PGYHNAFNPTIMDKGGEILLAARFSSTKIGIVRLNQQFQVIGRPQLLPIPSLFFPNKFGNVEDPRLVRVGDDILLVFNEMKRIQLNYRNEMRVVKLIDMGGKFAIEETRSLLPPEKYASILRQKNWTPFNYAGQLHLGYSITPHVILVPTLNGSTSVAETETPNTWIWGPLRGGTPAELVDDKYLTFFHSVCFYKSPYSKQNTLLHFFFGACLFNSEPPFEIEKISPHPIFSKKLYETRHFEPKVIVYPAGLIVREDHILLSYGVNDHKMFIARLNKEKLLKSLKPIR
ncbi:MAG: hypothetical protein KDK65_07135, partial [Chlamydiia bacterium]|nr:hypothetical protein [Chlamydiia bacterium]